MARKKKATADDVLLTPEVTTELPTDPARLQEYANLLFHRTVLQNPFIPIIQPQVNPDGTYKIDPRTGREMHGRPSPRQVAFLAYLGRDALYGGAAGGGKSDALLMCALQFVQIPGYSAIIFRRTLKMLEKAGGLIPRMIEWLAGTGARFNHTDRRWTFPSGATIEFGYIDTKRDFENYQGGSWQLCVGRGTPVRMADGTYRAIENVKVGDLVDTLAGPCPVTRLHPVRRDSGVLAVSRHGQQIQSAGHSLLTKRGWLAYRDVCDESLRPWTSEATSPHVLCRFSLADLDGIPKCNSHIEWWCHPYTKVIHQTQRECFYDPCSFTLLEGSFDLFDLTVGGASHYITKGGFINKNCAFDEAGQMDPAYIRYLFSRLRKPEGSQIPIRMRLASNPGGIGHEFLKRRYVIQGAPEFFVPSLAKDNPGIDVADYTKSMQHLDPILKAQLLAGDWSAYEGGRFKKSWFREFYAGLGLDTQPRYFLEVGRDKFTGSPVFDKHGVHVRDCFTVITCDPACTEDDSNCPTAIGVFAITPDRHILVLEIVRKWLDIDDIVPEIAELARKYGPIWVGIEDAGAFSAVSNSARRHPAIPAVKSISHESKSKLVRATAAIIRTEAGQVFLPPAERFDWVEDFVAECIQFTGDEEQDAYTDQVDMFSHCVRIIDRMGLAGPQVVFRDQDAHMATDPKRLTFLQDDGQAVTGGDEWDSEPTDKSAADYGGMKGWRR